LGFALRPCPARFCAPPRARGPGKEHVMSNILVYVLHYEGEFNKNSLGAVSEAAKLAGGLGGEAHAIVVGEESPSDDFLAGLGKYGATKVYRAKGPDGLAQPVID